MKHYRQVRCSFPQVGWNKVESPLLFFFREMHRGEIQTMPNISNPGHFCILQIFHSEMNLSHLKSFVYIWWRRVENWIAARNRSCGDTGKLGQVGILVQQHLHLMIFSVPCVPGLTVPYNQKEMLLFYSANGGGKFISFIL